jgi:hypothetical protein
MGTKRLEIEYHQHIPVSARKSYFLLPLKPDAYASQKSAEAQYSFRIALGRADEGFRISRQGCCRFISSSRMSIRSGARWTQQTLI